MRMKVGEDMVEGDGCASCVDGGALVPGLRWFGGKARIAARGVRDRGS
jgi:hypothetical protein